MDMKLIKKTKNELEIEITGETETLLNPITHILNENKDVEYASSIANHPLSIKRTLFIRMKTGDPQQALKKAVDMVLKDLKEFNKELK